MDDMTGDMLRAMNAQVCGMEDGIVSLTVDDSTITAVNAEGEAVFAHEYTYVNTVEDAIEGAPMFVFRTDDADAGKYTCLCLTQPAVASDEGGVIDNFNLRYAEADYGMDRRGCPRRTSPGARRPAGFGSPASRCSSSS